MALVLLVLAAIALVIAWALTEHGSAVAGSLTQDSPVSPPQEQLSPLPTTMPPPDPAQPAPTATPTPETQPAAPAAVEPPVPIGALIGVMAVIGLAALIIGLRRR